MPRQLAVESSKQQELQLDSSWTLLSSQKSNAKYFTSDRLNNVYTVSPSDELTKTETTGLGRKFAFSKPELGNLTYVDATNPFNILLFYRDHSTVLILDRTLTQLRKFDLFNLELEDINILAASNDQNLWIYDQSNSRIKKIDQNLVLLHQSDEIRNLVKVDSEPTHIIERGNRVYYNDPNVGVLVFDAFAKFERILPIKHLDFFQVQENHLIGKTLKGYIKYELKANAQSLVNLPIGVSNEAVVEIQSNVYFLLDKGYLKILKKG